MGTFPLCAKEERVEMNEREILKEWNAYIWGFLYRIPLSDPALSPEDFYAPAALSVLRSHESWNPEGRASLKTWIGNHLRWDLQDVLRKETSSRRRVTKPVFVPLEEEPPSPLPACELSVLALPYVEGALRALSPSHERALRARFFEGLTYREAGARRGVSATAESEVVQVALKGMKRRFGVVGEL